MRQYRRLPSLEMLETRLTPAIDFIASTFAFGTLNLVTDGAATTVDLRLTANNEVFVDDGINSATFTGVTTKLLYHGSDAGDTVSFDLDGFTLSAGVWLFGGAGNDLFTVQDTAGTGQLRSVLNIDAAEGNNTVEIDQLQSLSSVIITSGSGDDVVNVDKMTINGSFWATLGDGTNSLIMATTDPVTVGGNIKVSTGLGDDVISLGNSTALSVGGSVMVVAGDGLNDFDTGLGGGGVATIGGALTYAGGIGQDDVFIDQTTLGGSVSLGLGDGANTVNVASIAEVKIGGGFFVTGGFDDDNINIGSGSNVSIGGSITLNLLDDLSGDGDDVAIGGGNGEGGNSAITVGGSVVVTFGESAGLLDTFSMDNTIVRGSVSVQMGEGDNDFDLGTNLAVQITGSLLVQGGAGVDDYTIGGVAGTKINGSVSLNAGQGDNLWSLENDFFVRGNMTLTSGAGVDDLTLFATVSGGQVQGSLTVNLGGGANTFAFNGSVGTATLGGYLTYNGGNDVDNVTVNGRVFRTVTARLQGGNDNFIYGPRAFVGNPFINRRGTAYLDGGLGTNLFTNNGPPFLTTITRRTRIVLA